VIPSGLVLFLRSNRCLPHHHFTIDEDDTGPDLICWPSLGINARSAAHYIFFVIISQKPIQSFRAGVSFIIGRVVKYTHSCNSKSSIVR